MKKYYLFRHALATKKVSGYGDKIITAKIIPASIPPIEKMAQYLKGVPSDLNVSSEFIRCKETSAIVEKITGKIFVYDKLLTEYYKETFDQFVKRVEKFLNRINMTQCQNVVICTHGAVIAAIKNIILTGSLREDKLLDYPQCGVLLIIKDKNFGQMDFN